MSKRSSSRGITISPLRTSCVTAWCPRAHTPICPWKGEASYYDVVVGEHRNPDAAWFYPTPKDAAKEITDRVAFWKGIAVTEV